MGHLRCTDGLSGPASARGRPGSAAAGHASPEGLGEPTAFFVQGDAPTVPRKSEDRLEKRRQNNRQSQARYRNRQLGELQQIGSALEACQIAHKDARSRRLELLAANRTLNSRVLRADETLLSVLRGEDISDSGPRSDLARSCAAVPVPSPDASQHAGSAAQSLAARVAAAQPALSAETPARAAAFAGAAGESVGDAGDTMSKECSVVVPTVIAAPVTVHVPLAMSDMLPEPEAPGGVYAGVPISDVATGSEATAMSTGTRFTAMHADAAVDIFKARQMTVQLQDARRGAAAAAGVRPAGVRWVLQSPHEAAGGERLSFTSANDSHSCVASLYACHFTSLLEKAMLAAVLDLQEAAEDSGDVRGDLGCCAGADGVLGGGKGDPVSMLAALDTALTGAFDLESSELHVTCEVRDSVPVASAVPHAVTTVLRRYREFLPRPVWLRACDLYVQFMVGLTARKPLAVSPCPYGVMKDGVKVHTVNTCPRCCVFGLMFNTIRDTVSAAAEGRPWNVVPMPVAELRGRCNEIYSFCTLLVCQCMTDQPVKFRRMLCAARAISIRNISSEHEIVLELFQKMRLHPEQKRAAAAMWRTWRDSRFVLDTALTTAQLPLAGLLGAPDIVLGQQSQPEGHTVRSIDSAGWLGSGADAQHGTQHAEHGESGGIACGDVCLCVSCAANISGSLLGASSHSTAVASKAMDHLAAVHRDDADEAVELLRAMCIPGVMFTAEQYARQSALTLQQGAMVDWVWFCKTAAEELEREALYADMHKHCEVL
eukprot:jgi/Ulvmu1/11290/UM074_0005.1